MDQLLLENFRCFHERVEVPLRPLTLLVGENSTGKSSFLAAARAAGDLLWGPEVDFNRPPFDLGAFDNIASRSRGRFGKADRFHIGFGKQMSSQGPGQGLFEESEESVACVEATYASRDGQPQLSQLRLAYAGCTCEAKRARDGSVALSFVTPGGACTVKAPAQMGSFLNTSIRNLELLRSDECDVGPEQRTIVQAALGHLRAASRELDRAGYRSVTPIAPVRAKPKRTYDPKSDALEPEGDHVPMVLARLVANDPATWEKLREQLERFGMQSGLFKDISIRRFGSKGSGPFQVRVKISGTEMNLLDVGYGVSQVLPVITDALLAPRSRTFLLQQPEVHLHPKAQAQLGTLFGSLCKTKKHRFLIETHSDYLLDRVCLDVRDGTAGLRPDDVVILYFERKKGAWVTIHTIFIDENGNIQGAPEGYRDFFLNEQARHFQVQPCV